MFIIFEVKRENLARAAAQWNFLFLLNGDIPEQSERPFPEMQSWETIFNFYICAEEVCYNARSRKPVSVVLLLRED